MQPRLGERLRRLRHLSGYSLEDVARATNISLSFLSVVEAGKSDIAISRLMRLVKLYDASVLEVVEPVPEDKVVVRRGRALRYRSEAEGVEVEVLLPGALRRMGPSIFNYGPYDGHREDVVVDGDVFVYILTGTVAALFKDDDEIILRTGDSAYFSGTVPHRFFNVGKTHARVLSCTSPPGTPWTPSGESA